MERPGNWEMERKASEPVLFARIPTPGDVEVEVLPDAHRLFHTAGREAADHKTLLIKVRINSDRRACDVSRISENRDYLLIADQSASWNVDFLLEKIGSFPQGSNYSPLAICSLLIGTEALFADVKY